MERQITAKSHKILFFNTFAFTVCFAAWMLNGVLVTFLAENQIFSWTPVQIGWLLGVPVLTGAVFRLPAGLLTDRFGGKPVFSILLFLSAFPMFLLSYADSYTAFILCSFGFGLTGASFAVGIAFTSVWYPRKWQGTALGIFGAGNLGAALTTLFAPTLLTALTQNGDNLDNWRQLPVLYALILLATGVLFLLFTDNKKPAVNNKTLAQMLAPLKKTRVWRFGLFYFLVFGCFVAFSQWLVPYYVNVYYLPLITAGLLASTFSLPAGIIRAAGGWMSDRWGANKVMRWVLGLSVITSLLLIVPKMEITSPGKGVMAKKSGIVTFVSDSLISVGNVSYSLILKGNHLDNADERVLIFPAKDVWQQPVVQVGDEVSKKQLLARGFTLIYFQATIWVFVGLVILLGSVWGIGSAAVYKFIPDFYPDEVGVVGGMVGVLGGLGGFFSPIIFGYLLEGIGVWTSCWMFILLLSAVCLIWLQKSTVDQQAAK
ncbi:MAG: NarK/NasA family nitrate transporter [Calditrichaeota bacterium]|nr:MAG: NarK/NasA family nitrate transporter [Calditrichota bacterium]